MNDYFVVLFREEGPPHNLEDMLFLPLSGRPHGLSHMQVITTDKSTTQDVRIVQVFFIVLSRT